MIWIVISTIASTLLCFWLGNRRLLYLHQITLRKLLLFFIGSLSVYSLILFLFKIEVISEALAGGITANIYGMISGFLSGTALDQFNLRKSQGTVLYSFRGFMSDHLPIIIALGLILFGIYRTSVFSDVAITPIRVTSGLSILSVGLWGITLRLVPEFRRKGIVFLDLIINWDDMLNYQWISEEVIEVEYTQDDSIKSFKTIVPIDDRKQVEKLLSGKLREKLEGDN